MNHLAIVPHEQGVIDEEHSPKVSTAEITLKSATLPRRKIGRYELKNHRNNAKQ